MIRSGRTWLRPKERTPGVSITHPSVPGNRRAIADVEMCRPRPVTSLTSPMARFAPGINVLTRVDLPTPEWPTKTLRWPASACLNGSRSDSWLGHLDRHSQRFVLCQQLIGCCQVGLGETQHGRDSGVEASHQDAVDHSGPWWRIR